MSEAAARGAASNPNERRTLLRRTIVGAAAFLVVTALASSVGSQPGEAQEGPPAGPPLTLPPPPTLPPVDLEPLAPILGPVGVLVGPVCGDAQLVIALAEPAIRSALPAEAAALVESAIPYLSAVSSVCGLTPATPPLVRCGVDDELLAAAGPLQAVFPLPPPFSLLVAEADAIQAAFARLGIAMPDTVAQQLAIAARCEPIDQPPAPAVPPTSVTVAPPTTTPPASTPPSNPPTPVAPALTLAPSANNGEAALGQTQAPMTRIVAFNVPIAYAIVWLLPLLAVVAIAHFGQGLTRPIVPGAVDRDPRP